MSDTRLEFEYRASAAPGEPETAEDVLRAFVTEIRAYQSPECDECDILGPLLRRADAVLGTEP
jgi:hypothetical protein